MKYRKKPVVIDAIRWTGDNIEDIHEFMLPEKPVYMAGFSNADDILGIDTLEAGDDDDVASIEIAPHVGFVDGQDARLGMGAVGQHPDLAAGVALGQTTDVLQGHGQQADGDLLTGGRHHVQLSRIRVGLDLPGQGDEAIGLARHGRGHDHHLVAGARPLGNALGDTADALGRAHRGAAVFVNDQSHV